MSDNNPYSYKDLICISNADERRAAHVELAARHAARAEAHEQAAATGEVKSLSAPQIQEHRRLADKYRKLAEQHTAMASWPNPPQATVSTRHPGRPGDEGKKRLRELLATQPKQVNRHTNRGQANWSASMRGSRRGWMARNGVPRKGDEEWP